MKTFHPRLEVRLIKTVKRTELADGLPVANRYLDVGAIDLTPYLAESSTVSTQQYVGGGAGSWSMSLVDRMMPVYRASLYDMIEPMDMVEIRMARAPHEYQGSSGDNAYRLPVTMRGFVSSVSRSRGMSEDGHPMRMIQLAGHDFGKILEILRIIYLNNSVVGDNIVGELKFFHKFAGLDEAKIMSGSDFIALVLKKVINPFIASLTAGIDGQKVGAAVINQLTAQSEIEGNVSPLTVSNFHDGSVRQLLESALDVGAFNELFLDDREDETVLVVRPNPFVALDGGKIQIGNMPEIIDIADTDIISSTESRSDAGVANYFWVTNAGWNYIDNTTLKELAAAAPVQDYVLFKYPNTAEARYGARKMEVESRMGPSDQTYSDAASQAQSLTETDRRVKWLNERRRVLSAQNRDNVVFEDGQMVIKGNERLRRGMYLRVTSGDLVTMYYVTGAHQQYVPFQSFKTIVTFERGTGFVERARRADGVYLAELNLKGAL